MSRFSNNYYLMRHGESEANVAGLIISSPQRGCTAFGLTQQGEQQVNNAISTWPKSALFTQVICSDFLRARETAELVTQQLNLPIPQTSKYLRERYFGLWEGQSDTHYQDVWQEDEKKPEHTNHAVESPLAVQRRGLTLLQQLEDQYSKQSILLVSHGDMLQILRTAFTDLDAGKHRHLPHHNTAEIKTLAKQGELLPSCWQSTFIQHNDLN